MASRDDLSNSFLDSDAISDEFFIEIVENKLNVSRDEFKLRLVLLSPATGKNENFVAVLYRAKIKIEILATNERTTVDVIIKALLSTMPEMKEFGVFPRERFVYENVLKSFEDIWLERAEEVVTFGPKMIKTETDPYEQIILDDLKPEGFEMQNRKVGLTMTQTKMVLSKLAKFHAASAIRYQKDGVIQTYFDRKQSMPPMPEDSPFVMGFKRIFEAFREALQSYGDCDEFVKKIDNWDFGKMINLFTEVGEPMRSGFRVLNHGDMWLNNMMFRSDSEGNPLEVKLIDYQAPFWGSPAGDLIYFLMTSVVDEIKVAHFDEFISYYHGELVEALKKVKYNENNVPSLGELHIDIIEKGAFACSCVLFTLFIVKYDCAEEITLESLLMGQADQEMFDRIYKNDNYKKAIKLWLPFLNNRGFLDHLIKQEEEVKEEEIKEE